MEACKPEEQEALSRNNEANDNGQKCFDNKKKGGWITFPFITGIQLSRSLIKILAISAFAYYHMFVTSYLMLFFLGTTVATFCNYYQVYI